MRSKLLVFLAVAAVAAIAATSASALRIPTVGPRISLFFPPATFPADTPFHVNHGWGCSDPITDCLNSGTRFELLVDGVDVPAAHDLEVDPRTSTAGESDVSNFRQGLPAGTHTFEGIWYLDGAVALDRVVVITFT